LLKEIKKRIKAIWSNATYEGEHSVLNNIVHAL